MSDIINIKFYQIEMFRVFYSEFLKACVEKECEIYATSFPSEEYLWIKFNSTENQIKKFVAEGKKMNRIFFFNNPANKPNSDEIAVIKRHYQIYGVENEKKGRVYAFNLNNLEPYEHTDFLRIFLTEKYNKISWEIRTNLYAIEEIDIYPDEKSYLGYKKHFDKLTSHPGAVPITKGIIHDWEENIK